MVESLDEDGLCRQSAASIAEMSGMTSRGVEKIIASLTGKALSQVEKGGGRGKPSVYRLEISGLVAVNTERRSENRPINSEPCSENPKNSEPYSPNGATNPEPRSENPASIIGKTPNHIHRIENSEPHSPNEKANTEPCSENQPINPEPRSENQRAYKELTCLPTYPEEHGDSGRQVGGDDLTGQPAANLNPAIAAFEEVFQRQIGIYEQELIAAKIGAGNLAAWRVFLAEYKRDYPRAKNLMKTLSVFEQRQAELQTLLEVNGSIVNGSTAMQVGGRASPDLPPVRSETRNTAGNAAVLDRWVEKMERKYGNQ
jgi:hypothetical protein